MSTKGGDEQPTGQHDTFAVNAKVSKYDGNKKLLGVAVVTAIAAAAIVPYAAALARDNSNAANTDSVKVDTEQSGTQSSIESSQNYQQTLNQENGTTKNNSQQTTTVVVNGKEVPVPANGTYETTTVENGNKTDIKVDSSHTSNQSQNSSSSSSSVNIHVESNRSDAN